VNEVLDERNDPLSDRAVLDLLGERPERVAEVRSLTRALEALRTSWAGGPPALGRLKPAGGPHPSEAKGGVGAVRAAAASAVLGVAALSYWIASRPGASPPASSALCARDVVKTFQAGASPIVSWSVRVERRDAAVTTSDSLGSDGVRTEDRSSSESSSGSARIAVHSFTRHP
jgi:hypothetical protein